MPDGPCFPRQSHRDPEKYAPLHQVPSRLPVPLLSTKPVPWEDIRKLYIQGIVCGPGLPDRTELLERVGQADIFTKKGSRNGSARRQIMRLGKFAVVFPDYYGVAAHFGVPQEDVINKAREEDWPGLQKIYRAQLRQKAASLRVRERLANVEKIDERAYRVARQGLKMVAERMEMISQTVEIVDTPDGAQIVSAMDVRELESLGRSAQLWHALGRRALGFPVDKVGVVSASDAASMGEFGLKPAAVEDEPEEQLAVLGIGESQDSGSVLELASTESTAASELAQDDAARLHKFLSVLGRAQDASRSDPAATGHGLEEAPIPADPEAEEAATA